MPNTSNELLRVAAARADFLDSGDPRSDGVKDVVAASWKRSHAAGVDAYGAQSAFTEDIDPGSLLARCAAPVLEQLANDTADMPLVIALTDNRARLVRRIDSSSAVGRVLDRVDFAPGFTYAESTMGTNGIGTVFEAGRPISVVGPEHFTEQLQPFACSGAPIIDQATGRVEGVLDVSTLTHNWSPIMHALVKSAVADIGRNLLIDRSQAQQAVFATYLRASTRWPNHAVLAFGSSFFIANNPAQQLFTASEQLVIREHAEFLTTRRNEVTDTLALPDARLVHLRGTRIMASSQVAGVVVIAEIVAARLTSRPDDFDDERLPRVAVATPASPSIIDGLNHPRKLTGSRSPTWIRAWDSLHKALTDQRPSLVLGETGTGKFTMVAELFHSIYANARSININSSSLSTSEPADSSPAVAFAFESFRAQLERNSVPTLLVFRNLDQCTTESATRIDEFLTTLRQSSLAVWVVATLSDSSLNSPLPFRQLLTHFAVSITLPPLRLRAIDLPEITEATLQSLAPDRQVRLSPEAERIIARYSWPRNISQLRTVLEHALRRRPVGEIQSEDLPAYCQSTVCRNLTPLEEAERTLIVDMLRETDGNRVATARLLSMSRSSLYRKIKLYGVVT
ncbi:GAF domain-containing protein [Gordonia sp. PP30]|uniref:sigma-54-dependent Fis family transcriptional regulator n=1 Tax=Gordonia sp. PP30 TaxID=2935861 RepID=UPI001FFE6360|nr:helix-turn-helix domain-containing protein [Gordonia sp. PP30]UQE75134.1 GAF domain-containing protein [Gordonia sp. PP30]